MAALWAGRVSRWVEIWEEGGKPRCPKQRWRRLPEPSCWADVPPGGRSGRAWPPGLQRRAQEVGVERAGRWAGTGSAGSGGQSVAIAWRKRNRLGGLAGREGVAGKAREDSRPGTGRLRWWEAEPERRAAVIGPSGGKGRQDLGRPEAGLQEPGLGKAGWNWWT